ncbi:MAG TPA: hypothetical protein VF251_05550 [Pyrinomonadaceae bacterium]
MKHLVQKLMVVAMIGTMTATGFAQKSGDKGRPPRDPAKVVTSDKGPTPPPQNSHRPAPPDDKNKKTERRQ